MAERRATREICTIGGEEENKENQREKIEDSEGTGKNDGEQNVKKKKKSLERQVRRTADEKEHVG